MFATITRWLRPAPEAPPAAGRRPRVRLDASPAEAAPDDPAGLRARFLEVALARPDTFPVQEVAPCLAALQATADGDGFDALRLPRLPAVVPQLLQMLREDRASLARVATLAARDPLLAGGILRVANSAWYGSREPLDSLAQAVVRLGRDDLRKVVLQVALRPIHPAAPGTPVHAAGERLWTHAQCCGIACSALGHGFEGMLAGVAGATGASAALGVVARHAQELLHADAVHAAFPRAMWKIAARAAEAWALSAPVVAALHEHAAGAPRSGLARGMAQAELLSMDYLLQCWGEPAAPRPPDAQGAAAWAALRRHHPDG